MVFISTSGHGYLKVTTNQLLGAMKRGFKPTSFSFFNKSSVLLEEDCDMPGFIKSITNNDEEKKEFYKSIKDISQNDINRKLYSSLPDNITDFENMLSIWNLSRNNIGKTMVDIWGDSHTITGIQDKGTKGYLYRDSVNNTLYVMRIVNIASID